ncbi:MAG: hypothetical protein MZV70_40425 [Desulfobacterales bacterium]|nr:hypothetical protein [Desulfobacterales bacterium]
MTPSRATEPCRQKSERFPRHLTAAAPFQVRAKVLDARRDSPYIHHTHVQDHPAEKPFETGPVKCPDPPQPESVTICLSSFFLSLRRRSSTGRYGTSISSTHDDPHYVRDNVIVQNGLTWQGVRWAFTTTAMANWHPLTWLSYMLDCQLFGPSPGCPPSRQCPLSRDQFDPALSRPATDDGGPVEKRLRGCPFRVSSPSRGVGCMDRGTKRCAQHLFLAAAPWGPTSCMLERRESEARSLCCSFSAWASRPTHAGHAVRHPSADGLLAAETVQRRPAADARPPGPDRGIEGRDERKGKRNRSDSRRRQRKRIKPAPSFLCPEKIPLVVLSAVIGYDR